MTIRSNYIDDFTTYCKIKGYNEYENKTQYFFTCIQNTLKELGYYESISTTQKINNITHEKYTYLKPYHPIITGIIQTQDITTHWSWTIANSQKLHNNSTIICYIMHNILTK